MSMEGSSTNHMLSRGGASIALSIYISFHITVALEHHCKRFVSIKTFIWVIDSDSLLFKNALVRHTFTVPN